MKNNETAQTKSPPINSRQLLNRLIKNIMWEDPEDNIQFPKQIYFCENLGEPTFKITIEKVAANVFIDAEGNRWIRQDE
jgi:hypothetical protein